MRPRLFIFFIFFLLFSATTYISSTSYTRLKSHPFFWSSESIHTVEILSTITQCFSIFLGGICAAFIIPVPILLAMSLLNLLIGIGVFEGAFLAAPKDDTNRWINYSSEIFSQNYVCSVIVFYIMYGVYSGLSKFILLVMMLDQKEPTSIEYTATSYLFILNTSIFFVIGFFPTPTRRSEFYFTFSLPLILLAIFLLIIGRWKKLYQLDSKQLNLMRLICEKMVKTQIYNSYQISFKRNSNEIESIINSKRNEVNLENSFSNNSNQAILSFSKLCIIFILLLPYGVCESQLRTTFLTQSNYLRQPETKYYAMKGGFYVQIINCLGVVVLIPLIAGFRYFFKGFDKLYSKKIWRIIVSNIFMLISILSAAVLESIRLKRFWDLPEARINQTINGRRYEASDLSVFYMTPQLLFSSVSEILMVLTCTEFMYQQSISSIKYLAIAFFLGAVGSGGAGDVISLGITMILSKSLFDPSDLNKRILSNGTCCFFQSRIDYWFYFLAGFFFLSIIFTAVMLRKFKNHFEPESVQKTSEHNDGFFAD